MRTTTDPFFEIADIATVRRKTAHSLYLLSNSPLQTVLRYQLYLARTGRRMRTVASTRFACAAPPMMVLWLLRMSVLNMRTDMRSSYQDHVHFDLLL